MHIYLDQIFWGGTLTLPFCSIRWGTHARMWTWFTLCLPIGMGYYLTHEYKTLHIIKPE